VGGANGEATLPEEILSAKCSAQTKNGVQNAVHQNVSNKMNYNFLFLFRKTARAGIII
jgi:hypothetical protein